MSRLQTCFFLVSILIFPNLVLCTKNATVIIIGAGPAGVAAATRLLENGITDIIVLEAEDRIGGRINSVKFGDAYIDLGAHWCHGENDNIVYELAKDLNVLESTKTKPVIYFSSRDRLSDEFNSELNEALRAAFEVNTKGVQDSVENFYTAKYTEIVLSRFKNSTEKLRLALQATRLLEQYILAHRGAFLISDVILNRDYKICGGDLRLNWNGAGYKSILDIMIKRFPDPSKRLPFEEKLNLKQEVSNIAWDVENQENRVTTSDNGVYYGKYVVFTPSVGVLKNFHSTLFTPELPENKREAIGQIGLDAIVDASFYFPVKWWGDEVEEFYFIWDEEDIIKELELIAQYGRWILDIFNVTPNPKNPNVLTIWIVGSSVPKVEKLSDAEITVGVLYVFDRFLKGYNVSLPEKLIRSSWYSNPHFRGTYSYQTQAAYKREPSAEVELSKPLLNEAGEPRVLFAGEATHPHYYSTVHGAIETGYREADRILQLAKKK